MKDYKKICVICEEKIDFKKDSYVRMTDFTGKKQTGECFHHLECWKHRFQITQEKITQQANEWMTKLTDSIGEITGGKSYEIIK